MKKILLTAALAVAFGHTAFATVEAELCTGANGTGTCSTILTGVAGTPSIVTLSGSLNGWTVTGNGATISYVPPTMDLSTLTINSTTASTLYVLITDVFTVSTPGLSLSSSGHIVDSGSGSETYSVYTGTSAFNFGTLVGTQGPETGGYTLGPTDFATAGLSSPYYITEQLEVTSNAGGVSWSTDSSLTGVPEPGSLMLLGTAVLFGAAAIRRRKSGKV